MSRQNFVRIRHPTYKDTVIQIPLNEWHCGKLRLSRLKRYFPKATGLKYPNSVVSSRKKGCRFRALKMDGRFIYPPKNLNWDDYEFELIEQINSSATEVIMSNHKISKLQPEETQSSSESTSKITSAQQQSGPRVTTSPTFASIRDHQEATDLIVLGLHNSVDEAQLKQYFQKFGPISFAHVKRHSLTGQSRGFGFIRFAEALHEANCLRHPQPHLLPCVNTGRSSSDDDISPVSSVLVRRPIERRADQSYLHKIHVAFLPPPNSFSGCCDKPQDLQDAPIYQQPSIEAIRRHFELHGGSVVNIFMPSFSHPHRPQSRKQRRFAFVTFDEASSVDRLLSSDGLQYRMMRIQHEDCLAADESTACTEQGPNATTSRYSNVIISRAMPDKTFDKQTRQQDEWQHTSTAVTGVLESGPSQNVQFCQELEQRNHVEKNWEITKAHQENTAGQVETCNSNYASKSCDQSYDQYIKAYQEYLRILYMSIRHYQTDQLLSPQPTIVLMPPHPPVSSLSFQPSRALIPPPTLTYSQALPQ